MFQEKPLTTMGSAKVVYNNKEIVDGKYNCKSELRAGNQKDKTHIEVKNEWVPVGADYVHEYDASRDVSNRPTVVGASNKSVLL